VSAGATVEVSERDHEVDGSIRARLLAAAARVFARQGYEGAKISDIVREAGLSTGAVYGRFRSKNELLRMAVVERASHAAELDGVGSGRVADLLVRAARETTGPLSDGEAVRLEAFVAARREPEVAQALLEATVELRGRVQPFVDAAFEDGTLSSGLDPEAVLFFVRTVGLGLLLQRAAGMPAPDPGDWERLVAGVIASLGDGDAGRTHR
jgi:AcrR family transcriptional regulator